MRDFTGPRQGRHHFPAREFVLSFRRFADSSTTSTNYSVSMGHTYASNLVHIVFSTKDRRASIPSHKLHELWAYMQGITRNLKAETLAIGGISDHVHVLVSVPKSMALSDLVMKLKANSSKWMGPNFVWQEGYGAFSVSPSNIETVQRYIRNQAEHHRKRDFREEFRILLEKSGIKFDPAGLFG